jgi:hypothetical protein
MALEESRLHGWGSFGLVREYTAYSEAFPMIKLAHSSKTARQLIQNEYSTISYLLSHALPVVQIDTSSPL